MRRVNGVLVWGAMMLCLVGSAAGAREYYRERGHKLSLVLKGGGGNYTGVVGSYTQTGPTWGLTLGVQPLHMLGFEVGYDGGYNTVSAGSTSFGLLHHGASGLVKLSLPFVDAVKPFLGVGVGGSYVLSGSASSGGYSSGLLAEVPLVAGIEFNVEAFTAGLRATYRVLLNQQVYSPTSAPSGFFDVSVTLGVRF